MPYPDENNLTTLATLKAWLDVTDTSADAALTALITRASQYIVTWLNRSNIFSAQFTETRSGNGRTFLMLSVRPVTAVSLVSICDQIIPARPVGQSSAFGYTFDKRGVYLTGYRFYWGEQNIQVQYTAGVSAGSKDQGVLEQACLELCDSIWKRRGKEFLAGLQMNGVSNMTFKMSDIPDPVLTELSNIKNVVPMYEL